MRCDCARTVSVEAARFRGPDSDQETAPKVRTLTVRVRLFGAVSWPESGPMFWGTMISQMGACLRSCG